MRRRDLLALTALAGAAVLLSGCVGIPTSGPVHEGGGVANERDDPFTRPIVAPPRVGMSAKQVVQGFLLAAASFDDDHAVAREFLTADAARTWNADAGVTVYDSSAPTALRYTARPGGVVRFSAPLAGRISRQNEYDAQPGGVMHQDFRLAQVAGQWRIARLADGLLLNTYDIGRSYRQYDVYFPDPSRTVLVPEPVLVPVGPGVSTSLVRALMAGPSPWLAPAVRTAIPAGSKLVVDSAPISDGVVQVNLTAPAATAVGREAAAMSAQFVWTLRQLSGVSAIRLSVEDVPVRVPGVGAVQTPDVWPSFDPDGEAANADAFFEAGGRLQELKNDRAVAVQGPAGNGRVALSRPAVSFDETMVAGLDPSGRRLIVGQLGADGHLVTAVDGRSLTPPSWDRFGAVWAVDRTARGPVLWQVRPGQGAHLVATRGLPRGEVTAFRVARDGVRVAAVVRGPHGGMLYLGRIERAGDQPVVGGFRPLRTRFADVIDVAWASADRIAVLARITSDSAGQPWIVDLYGATIQALGPVPGQLVASLSAAPTHPVLAATASGTIFWFSGIGWTALGKGSGPAYPG